MNRSATLSSVQAMSISRQRRGEPGRAKRYQPDAAPAAAAPLSAEPIHQAVKSIMDTKPEPENTTTELGTAKTRGLPLLADTWPSTKGSSGVHRQSEASRRVGTPSARDVQERQTLSEPKRCPPPLALLPTRIFKSPAAAWRSSGRSDIFIASRPCKPTFKLRRSGMEDSGEPRATGLQPSHAAPTELDSAGRPLRYKHVAPTGACTDPREDPCKEQPLATALQSGLPATARQTLSLARPANIAVELSACGRWRGICFWRPAGRQP